jgi:hypothetical protein
MNERSKRKRHGAIINGFYYTMVWLRGNYYFVLLKIFELLTW